MTGLAGLRGSYSRASFVKSLRTMKARLQEPLTMRAVQLAVVKGALDPPSAAGEWNPAEAELQALYERVLTRIKVRFSEIIGEGASLPASADPELVVIPQYETTWRYVEQDLGQRRVGMIRMLHEIANWLDQSGFSRCFARVYVTDDLETTREQLWLGRSGGNPFMELSLPLGAGGVEIPILCVQYTEQPVPLAACLTHEVMHLLVYYLWGLRRPSFVSLEPLLSLATSLAAEAFAHMQTAAIFGESYLISILTLEELPEPKTTKSEETPGAEALRDARSFLEYFPLVAATWALEAPDQGLVDLYFGLLPASLRRTATLLKPVCLELFEGADLTAEIHAEVERILGPGGPADDLFALAALAALQQD